MKFDSVIKIKVTDILIAIVICAIAGLILICSTQKSYINSLEKAVMKRDSIINIYILKK